MEVVLADVGDMQTIVDDLSTYSAHLVASFSQSAHLCRSIGRNRLVSRLLQNLSTIPRSRIMLSSVQQIGPRAMVLVDEVGYGELSVRKQLVKASFAGWNGN